MRLIMVLVILSLLSGSGVGRTVNLSMESNFSEPNLLFGPETELLLEQHPEPQTKLMLDPENPSTLDLLTILKILDGSAVQFQQKTTNQIINDVKVEPMITNQIAKRHNFVRNRRPMSDCLSNCIRRVQRVIACKNLCF